MNPNFTVTVGDVDKAIAIMREVAQWCMDTGKKTWSLDELTKEKLTNSLNAGNFITGNIDGDPACCMILQWIDPLFWPEAPEYEAGYVHKLCVKREFAGMNLSAKMIAFAAEECRLRNVPYLRLDTGLYKQKLCSIYENLGFTKVGETTNHRGEFALYEKKTITIHLEN